MQILMMNWMLFYVKKRWLSLLSCRAVANCVALNNCSILYVKMAAYLVIK